MSYEHVTSSEQIPGFTGLRNIFSEFRKDPWNYVAFVSEFLENFEEMPICTVSIYNTISFYSYRKRLKPF